MTFIKQLVIQTERMKYISFSILPSLNASIADKMVVARLSLANCQVCFYNGHSSLHNRFVGIKVLLNEQRSMSIHEERGR